MSLKARVISYLVAILAGIVIAAGYLSYKSEVKIIRGPEVVRITLDTIFVEQPPRILTKTITVKEPYALTKIDTVYKVDKIAYYKDTVVIEEGLTLNYRAKVLGRLDSISLGYVDTRPIKTVIKTETVTETVTVKVPPRGLYVGLTSDVNLSTSANVTYLGGKNMMGVGVKLNDVPYGNPSKYSVTYSRRLF